MTTTTKRRRWTKEEEEFLINNYSKMKCKQIAEKLGKTYLSVASKVNHLGIYK